MTPSGISYDDISTEIESYIKEYEARLVSVGSCVFDETGIIYEGYYGYSDMEKGIVVDEETVYDWASTSKLFVRIPYQASVRGGNHYHA